MAKNKIALCFPNFNWLQANPMYLWHMFPDTLCLLAAAVRELCDATIIDANKENLSPEEFQARIADGGFDLVGISVLMDGMSGAGHLAVSLAKRARPGCKTVMGGVYPTMSPAHAMANPELDFVCIGEGEESFPRLIRHLFLGGDMPDKGFAYRNGNEVAIQARAPFVEDLDALPAPAYDLVDYGSYTTAYARKTVDGPVALPYVDIVTARGCPQNCSFCQAIHISGRKIRVKSAEKVLEELEYFKERYGIRSFIFMDDNTFTVRQRIDAILQGLIERRYDLPWKSAATPVFRLDEKLLTLMAGSGCRYICVAIESGTPRVLKEVIGKPVDLVHAKKMIALARSLGIFVAANFIIGFPGETWEEIRQTVRVAEELEVDYMKLFSAIPLPHTRLWDICERDGLFAPGFDSYSINWNKGQIRSRHYDDRELTILRAYEWDRINFSTPEKIRKTADMMGVSIAELNAIRRNTRDSALANLAYADRPEVGNG